MNVITLPSDFLPKLMMLVLAIELIVFVVISLVLNFHWKKYGFKREGISTARVFYYTVSVFVISTMAGILIFMNV